MSHQSDLISTDIDAYLAQHERKELLRFLTCGQCRWRKSTLIGRLLHDSKMIYEDQLAAVQADSVKSGTTGAGKIDLALLVDGLQAEREQGITIDVAYRYFSTSRVNLLLPIPRAWAIHPQHGHRRLNLWFGHHPDWCPLRRPNPNQTAQLYRLFTGIQHIIVAVNKMDLIDYSEATFKKIKQDYLRFTDTLDLHDICFIPMSALDGDNVVNRSEQMPCLPANR